MSGDQPDPPTAAQVVERLVALAVRYAVEHLDPTTRQHYRTLTHPATTS